VDSDAAPRRYVVRRCFLRVRGGSGRSDFADGRSIRVSLPHLCDVTAHLYSATSLTVLHSLALVGLLAGGGAGGGSDAVDLSRPQRDCFTAAATAAPPALPSVAALGSLVAAAAAAAAGSVGGLLASVGVAGCVVFPLPVPASDDDTSRPHLDAEGNGGFLATTGAGGGTKAVGVIGTLSLGGRGSGLLAVTVSSLEVAAISPTLSDVIRGRTRLTRARYDVRQV